ncbi:hypothetical protein ACFFW8_20605 [Erwinia tracheiphila]
MKLNHADFKLWADLYSSIDLVYELQKLDIEFSHDKPKKLVYHCKSKKLATRTSRP